MANSVDQKSDILVIYLSHRPDSTRLVREVVREGQLFSTGYGYTGSLGSIEE